MDLQTSRILIAVFVIVLLMIVILSIYFIRLVRQGKTIYALMGLTGFMAGITYEMDRPISYGFLGIVAVIIVIEVSRILKDWDKDIDE